VDGEIAALVGSTTREVGLDIDRRVVDKEIATLVGSTTSGVGLDIGRRVIVGLGVLVTILVTSGVTASSVIMRKRSIMMRR
jgi:hypothetical protein